MKCSQCGTELPSSATFCPRCGTDHQGTSGTSTNPTPFSYLPAGTPPWPTSVPDKISFVAVADPEAPPIELAEKKPAAKPKRSTRSVLTLVGLIILVPLIGSLYALSTFYINNLTNPAPSSANIPQNLPTTTSVTPTPNAANTPQLPAPTSFKSISSVEANLSLQYPADWQEEKPQRTQDNAYIGRVYPQQQIGILFNYLRYSEQTSTTITNPDQIHQTTFAAISQDQALSDFKEIPAANTQPTIGGAQWSEKDMSAVDKQNNVTYHFTSITVKRDTTYYQVFFYAPDVIYNEAMQKYFQPILNSLKFLS